MKSNLILWRHADAEAGADDLARHLTDKGHKQAARVARWLKARLPDDVRVVASEALRARETAAALTDEHRADRRLNPGVTAAQYLEVANWPDGGTVVLVGHQPDIGRAAALLMTGGPGDWDVRKGAVWWFQSRTEGGDTTVALKAVLDADGC